MLITISFASSLILANHHTTPGAVYIEDLGVTSMATRKGIAADGFKFSIHRDILDNLGHTFLYLCYNTTATVLLNNQVLLTGYVDKLSIDSKGLVVFDISSMIKYYSTQMFTPSIAASCQNEVYSENCKLKSNTWSYYFQDVAIDGLTGEIQLDIANKAIALGGSTFVASDIIADGNLVSLDGNSILVDTQTSTNNSAFLQRELWWGAYVIINGYYRSNVVNVTDDAIFINMNFMDKKLTAETVQLFLKCDKTYGQCYLRFDNTNNFWGFDNTGRRVNTFDIFSASELEYCGDQSADTHLENCDSDHSLFGVNLNG